jgi:hypothetical protein
VQTEVHEVGGIGANELASTSVSGSSCTNCTLTYDSDGRLTGASSGSTFTPGGSNTNVQFNDAGTLSGNGGLTYDKTLQDLTVGDKVTATTGAAAGGSLTLGEKTGNGSSTWKLDLAAVDLSGNFTITPATDGTLSAATLLRAADNKRIACIDMPNLTAAATPFITAIPDNSTLVKAWCITSGTVTTAPTIHIDECSSAGASCNRNTTSALTCNGSGAATTTFGGAGGTSLLADEWMQAEITNTPTVTGITTVCIAWTAN